MYTRQTHYANGVNELKTWMNNGPSLCLWHYDDGSIVFNDVFKVFNSRIYDDNDNFNLIFQTTWNRHTYQCLPSPAALALQMTFINPSIHQYSHTQIYFGALKQYPGFLLVIGVRHRHIVIIFFWQGGDNSYQHSREVPVIEIHPVRVEDKLSDICTHDLSCWQLWDSEICAYRFFQSIYILSLNLCWMTYQTKHRVARLDLYKNIFLSVFCWNCSKYDIYHWTLCQHIRC